MGAIKEIYDLIRDGAKLRYKVRALKRALRVECVLNNKSLSDIIRSKPINDGRRKQIISSLLTLELHSAIKFEIPYAMISKKKVSTAFAEDHKIKRIAGHDLETMIVKLYIKIADLKAHSQNNKFDLNSRLIFIAKYNNALLELLS